MRSTVAHARVGAGPGRLATALVGMLVLALVLGQSEATAAQPVDATPSPSGTDTPPEDATAADPATDLPARLDAVMARFGDLTGSSTVSVVVTDDQGERIWSAGPDRALMPASTMKVLTAASVLDEFGPAGVVHTGAAATAPVDGAGVVDGDVVVVGSGDPTLTTDDYRRWIYPARPSTEIEGLADTIVASGITRITGDLVGDGSRFGPSQTAAGWPERYFADFDAHRLASLSVDTGRDVLVDESSSPPRVVMDHDTDPALGATVALAEALADRGVTIDRYARRSLGPSAGMVPLGRVKSPPMTEVLGFMLRESDNHMADTLVRTAALQETGDGSWSAADGRVREALDGLGVDTGGLVVADGSGLSRNNRVTPTQLVLTDVGLTTAFGDTWSSMLAVGGESGTLQNRLLGTSAQGRLYGKTGTLADVRALVGHVVGTDDARYHFAMIVNDVDTGIRYLASVLADEVALVLTDALDGCERVREVTVEVPAEERTDAADASPAPESTAAPAPTETTTTVPATVDDPGPYLQDGGWQRVCPDD